MCSSSLKDKCQAYHMFVTLCYASLSCVLKHDDRTTEGLYSDKSNTYLDVIHLFT